MARKIFTNLEQSVRVSYLIPYAVLAVVLVALLAGLIGWQIHGNYNDGIDNKVERRLNLSKE